MSELEMIYGVEFVAERQIYQVVLVQAMERACQTTALAQMQCENVADAMNRAHYRALGQEWTRPAHYPLFVKRPEKLPAPVRERRARS